MATYAPVMLAVRVPPSACSTSQSTAMVRSPITPGSMTARRLRPISRWISMVRPPCRPRAASREVRVGVAPGSMLYSAVSQPRPAPRSQPGTPSLSEAVQWTCVSPSSMRAEPAANLAIAGVMRTGRNSSALRPVLKADPPRPPEAASTRPSSHGPR